MIVTVADLTGTPAPVGATYVLSHAFAPVDVGAIVIVPVPADASPMMVNADVPAAVVFSDCDSA